ncbi:M1 family metallopeptidase [Micromonospora polyrhachis]|uniref:Aminopeptidase N n=1 Tax=Micromonospora polyrhachis TaxID=1282883 RepID=A0A7W7SNQ8_9ACTN|nr:M1 family metallopeptidase [Micromonospora polyrhachis]MBB4958150.1 aminopeptidase N [Micromonospora polyrhachis]
MSRSRRTAIAALLVSVLAVAGCTGGRGSTDPTARPDPTGSSSSSAADGIGDPYFPSYGNGGYDVASYALKVRYDPASDVLTGVATIAATATEALSRFNLDLAGLTVESVEVDGAKAGNERRDNELVVIPGQPIAKDQRFTVKVDYGGKPRPITNPALGSNGFSDTPDGAIALGQPESASTWFPVNDHPSDKATYEIEATVPAGLSALSNGIPLGVDTADGWSTWRWAERVPMASYLTTLVIGDYRVVTGTHGGKPMVTAVASSLPKGGAAEQAMARTGEVADFLVSQFGPYPFQAYGGIVVDDDRIRYALETQSRPVYGSVFFRGGPELGVVAHELAHQWFGDSVSLRRWSDMWLNEGFASYAEWLWEEHAGGRSVQQNFTTEYANTDWARPALDPGPTELFGRAVYKRGALVVHALRLTVGDEAFFRILKTWTAEKRDGIVTTDDFFTVAERVAGKPLRPVLGTWLSGTSAPPVPGG